MSEVKSILPGRAVGVLGSGQLGRMFAIAARRMGYRVHTYSSKSDTPTGQLCDREVCASYDDLEAVRDFARGVDVVTFEFENVPAATVEACAQFGPVRPGWNVLYIAQNRLREKNFLAGNGFPVAPFRAVNSQADLQAALDEIGTPCVLKTAGFGYDGKGQTKINKAEDAETAWQNLGGVEGVVEGWISFEREISVVAARGTDGAFAHWGAVENHHENHILDVTTAPANISSQIAKNAIEITRGILEKLEVVGVLCVEFFLTQRGELIVNEMAPRPHNSGHFSFDASLTSQFEQQLRAVCALPLGSTELLRPAAMANLLGDLWRNGEPNWAAALEFPEVKLHLYGKSRALAGRKMGHLTALADSPEQAAELVRKARVALMENI